MNVKKIFNKLQTNQYFKFCKKPIRDTFILFEAGQGKNINGNMFALIRELKSNEKFCGFNAVFVVTEETKEAADKRFKEYKYDVELVIRNSKRYKEYLATCKYLFTDNSFPPYFCKRENQVYLNTWHGTPLKTLGKSDLKNAKSLANIQKNYLMSDYALFPNEFCRDVFMDDYMLENIFKGEILLSDYPRNSVFLNSSFSAELRNSLKLNDKQLIAYMPTWRGTNRNADAEIQKEILEKYFLEIDRLLQDNQIFYVNLHFLIGNNMNFDNYQHIKPFPSEYETYDFLSICDILVTDYSSVFFDFAVTKKKIILFAYDLDDYMRDRGTYFPITDLPFPIVDSTNDLIDEINKIEYKSYDVFLSTYCQYAKPNTSESVLNLMLFNQKEEVLLEKARGIDQSLILVYAGKLKNEHVNTLLLTYINEAKNKYKDSKILLCFQGSINKKKVELLEKLPREINYYAVVNKLEFTFFDKVKLYLAMHYKCFSTFFDSKKSLYRERERLYYHISPCRIVYFSGIPQYMYRILTSFHCSKEAHLHHSCVIGANKIRRTYSVMRDYFNSAYNEIIDHRQDDVHMLWSETPEMYYNKCLKVGCLFKHFSNTKEGMKMYACCISHDTLPFPLSELKIKIADCEIDAKIKKIITIKKHVKVSTISFIIPYGSLRDLEIQNKLNLYHINKDGYGLCKGIKYNLHHHNKGRNHRGPIFINQASHTSSYFRQTANNIVYLTVRNQNLTDNKKEQWKLNLAYLMSKVIPYPKTLLLFEKESARYEESASVLYERLIDENYNNAYFIIDKAYSHIQEIGKKYKKNLLYKGTFKHYFLFFKSKTFLGSEALVHAIDLRVANRFALKKLAQTDINYIFLQHGVMYMVSLDSESRKFFKPKKTKGKYRVVVSSKVEARHFTELGNYNPEFIYISGLPKYDRNTLNKDADKITIMPTWRPWEYNEARYDFLSTNYYQMILRIFNAIPERYKDSVIILPHPLFWDAVKDSDFPLRKYLNVGEKYDDILKKTRILITDYSSIAYDAFYRGSNVIFYWEEKDECMSNYGPSTKLMLNDDNVFGDICMNDQELSKIIEKNLQAQNKEYIKRYKRIVTYHDGKNTQRLIEFLKKDGII